MRVLIADDHPFVRKGIREVLAEELGIRDIVETSDGLSAYDLLVSERFDLAVIDISMPGKDGLELMKDVLALRPTVPFLVMSVHPEQELAERAYQCGAKGYLGKLRPLSEFVEAARRILAGGVYVNPALAQTLVERLRAPREKNGLDLLTDRELAVLRLYASGAPLTEIGKRLHLSVKTVSTHKSRAMEKLALRSNADLVAFALAHGIVERKAV